MNRTKWTLEKLHKTALLYSTRSEFQKNNKTAYNIAQRKKVLNNICSHMEVYDISGFKNPNFKWTQEMLQTEASKYKTRGEFKKGNSRAYAAAWDSSILDKICTHMRRSLTYWSNDELATEALKYQTRKDFQDSGNSAYQIARKRNILDSICVHMVASKNSPYSMDELKEEALKYNTRSEFSNKNSGAYQSALRNNLLDDICIHMESCKWTDQELAEEALKYQTRKDFNSKNNGAYSTAQQRGLLNEICKHAPKTKGTSLVQKEVANFIRNFYPEIIEETHKIIPPLELDIYIPSLNLAIEYCGLYWHSEEYKTNNYHYNKMKLCNEKGIRLITIFEDEWLEREKQVKNFILSVIGKNEITLMGRKTDIRKVPKKEAVDFLEKNHIQGSSAFEVAFGLYYNNELVGIITGNKHHRQGHGNLFVLNRLAFKSNTSVSGGSSKLLKALIQYAKEKGYEKLISWSDNRWSEGNVYKKTGFSLTEELPPDYSYVRKQTRISKQSCQKKNLIKKGAIGNTEREMALSLKLHRIYDCGKKRWEIYPKPLILPI